VLTGQSDGAGMPLTVTMDAAQSVVAVFSPLFVDVTTQVSWKANWVFEPGAHYLVDRGYLDFERLYGIGSAGSFFVTRAKKNTLFMRRYSRPADKALGLRSDQEGVLCGVKAPKQYPAPIRRVTYRDPKTDKRLCFLSNSMLIPAIDVCRLYKMRWQVELFFKWIKQHLRIKRYLGTSQNTVHVQIRIASPPTPCQSLLGEPVASLTIFAAPDFSIHTRSLMASRRTTAPAAT